MLRDAYAEICAIILLAVVAIGGIWLLGTIAQRAVISVSEQTTAPTPTPTAQLGEDDRLSMETLRCITNRVAQWSEYTEAELPTLDPAHPARQRMAHLTHGCLTDAEALRWRPGAAWPPSYQRCIENDIGIGAFVEFAIADVEDLVDELPDSFYSCLPQQTPTPTPATGIGS